MLFCTSIASQLESFLLREVFSNKLLGIVQPIGSNTENCPFHPFQNTNVDDSWLEPIFKRLLALLKPNVYRVFHLDTWRASSTLAIEKVNHIEILEKNKNTQTKHPQLTVYQYTCRRHLFGKEYTSVLCILYPSVTVLAVIFNAVIAE